MNRIIVKDRNPEILIATNNPGKIGELRGLLGELPVVLRDLFEFEDITEIEETGKTFGENARLKACGYAAQTRLHALADDSGLEVAALGDAPGVVSARYGGADTSFAEKIAMVLREIAESNTENRNARFVCHIACADPKGKILFEAEGICDGKIASEPSGNGGFGYDPVFIPNGFDETFGELSGDIKQQISHRARAFEQIIPFLRLFYAI